LLLTIVTPTFNEESSIKKCIEDLKNFMELSLPALNYEHIIIDNASSDRTVEIAEKLAQNDRRIKIIVNSRNIGAPQNILRGLTFARGNAVIPMLPADLQDPVFVIKEFYEKWTDGYKVVYGIRSNRQENFILRSVRRVYYKLIAILAHFEVPQNAGDFMLIDRSIVDMVNLYPKQDLYLRGFVSKLQFQYSAVKYTWIKRKSGKSKSSMLILIDTAMSGLINTSRLPARIALAVGGLTSILSILYAFTTLLLVIFGDKTSISGVPTLIVLVSFIGGIQLIFLGLIGEYVLGVFSHLKPDANVYSLREVNFD
jgi:glycosyltransferase involved in cell wall biosynthesis